MFDSFHLALRCASATGISRTDDARLLAQSAVSSDALWWSLTEVEEHLEAHPDDVRLQRARDVLVLAYFRVRSPAEYGAQRSSPT